MNVTEIVIRYCYHIHLLYFTGRKFPQFLSIFAKVKKNVAANLRKRYKFIHLIGVVHSYFF